MPPLHLLSTQQAPRCYLSLRLLPPSMYPARVRRRGHRTLLINDPRATRLEVTDRNVQILSQEEANVYRAAFGCPPVNVPMPPSMLEGPVFLYVPQSLRLPGEQATQGGVELLRRYQAGTMPEELAMLAAEVGPESGRLMPTVRELEKNKRYQGVYRDASGRRHTRVFPTRTAARTWAADGEAAVRNGSHRDPRAGRTTLKAWHTRWVAARVVEDSTRRTDKTYGADVLKAFGEWPLDSITRMEVQGWVRRLEQDGRGPTAIGKAYQLLSSLLEDAVREGKIPANPARGVRLPHAPRQPDRILTVEEEAVLLDALPTAQDRRMVVVLLDTAMRYGELAGLHAHRVDMLRREVHVVEVLTQAGRVKAYPKSRKSRRTLPLSDRALEALAVQQEHHADGLVFRTRRGARPMLEANWRRRAWLPAVAKLGEPVPKPHDCRHTCLSRLIAEGVDVKTVQEFAGHESLQTTLRYLHSAPDAGERVRAALRRISEARGADLAHPAVADLDG